MLTKIDTRNNHVIFKVCNSKGKLVCYRVFPTDMIGDSAWAKEFKTLTQARSATTKKALGGSVGVELQA
jgi:hypothetical protein